MLVELKIYFYAKITTTLLMLRINAMTALELMLFLALTSQNENIDN